MRSIIKHANDHTSTCAWVQELKKLPYNPVLVFKPQGEEQSDDIDNLSKDDFLLALQTEFQRDTMKQYGNEVIMMDATHGTTQYNFQLITMFVIDDHGAGLPVAWAISNREDTTLLTEFLKAVHARVGDIQPTYFMSDCAEQYFSSWCGVFGRNVTQKLLCIWHIDRAWRKGLSEHVPCQQHRIEIYHQLRVLLQQRSRSDFMARLQQLISYLHEKHEGFHKYFNTQYVPHVQEWATCYRVGTIVNTNMFAEAFHRVLKVVYFNNKQNRRVDYLVHTLLRAAKNLIYDRLRKIELKASTHRKCEINKRHKLAQELMKKSTCMLQSCGSNTWRMESATSKGTFYIIQVLKKECDCPLCCPSCKACVLMYSCTCLDSTVHSTVCKHIHYFVC